MSTDEEHRATVRIDEAPGGKRFQGVWLEFDGGTAWVVDYRPRVFWQPFKNQEVIVTGHIYTPRGQAIRATHFHVDRMRFVTPRRGFGAILELWPELELRGKFRTREGEVGSKSEGSTETSFVDDGGTSYMLQGAETKLPEPGKPVWIKARGCVPDYSFVATTTSDRAKLWILEVRDHEHVRE